MVEITSKMSTNTEGIERHMAERLNLSILLQAVDERDDLRAEVTTLEWQLSEATKAATEACAESERLSILAAQWEVMCEDARAALEEIANMAHPPDMRAVNIARRALGRDNNG